MSTHVDRAVQRFAEGFSCSQAVFSTFASGFGVPDETALRVASAFGGGVGRRGEVCGAVTGALMALGLARGHADNGETSKAATYELVDEFVRRFEAAHGAITCRTLIGHSIATPEGLEGARDAGVFKAICPGLVADATAIVASILERRPNRDEVSQ
jgi:C_GCAxxG_C_C family probable redox protein